MVNLNKISNLIAEDEGFRPKIYKDINGFNTIGFGFNLDKIEISSRIAALWLEEILIKRDNDLSKILDFWKHLNDARKYVLINMSYQLGINGLMNFKNMMKYMDKLDYNNAAKEMQNSQWYELFKGRATRLINIMSSGKF